jgi:hypothetical protein
MRPKSAREGLKCKFFLAEDIRTDEGGKLSLLGLYPDDVIWVILPSEIGDPTEEMPLLIEGISICASFSEIAGEIDLRTTLTGPSGKVILDSGRGTMTQAELKRLNLTSRFRPMVIPALGKYLLTMELLGHTFRYEFSVQRQNSSAPPQPRLTFAGDLPTGLMRLDVKPRTEAQRKEKRSSKVATKKRALKIPAKQSVPKTSSKKKTIQKRAVK